MFLKSLQIKGFKSFADPAELSLEPGVSVVVGPNGSGKSNVVDAIGWVLGAQKPSTVRSQKMDDVIFAGTAKRPALGRAEVSLTLDNSSGIIPIEFTEVTISRLLFRTGESEYSINGSPVRLLDIQDLLSDSGVGRQQHVIISQGNIDAVLNARPEDRRLIIEEAAGVLKYRKRKERAERRLQSTEANLTRIQDLLREVRSQLRPLNKQADAARRHGDLMTELTALRIYVAGQDLLRLERQREARQNERQELHGQEITLREQLGQLDAQIIRTEGELSGLGGRDIGDALVRYEKLREKARGLSALMNERIRGIERELQIVVDAGVIASLEGEHARLVAESAEADEEAEKLQQDHADLQQMTEHVGALQQQFEETWGEGVPAPTGEAAVLRGEISALQSAIERTQADQQQIQARQSATAQRVERLSDENSNAKEQLAVLEAQLPELQRSSETAHAERAATEAQLDGAEDRALRANTEASGWQARVEALTMALAEARQAAGAELVAELDGVFGTVLDVISVDSGWEQAVEAAAGESLRAVIVENQDVAKRALTALIEGDHSAAVLALQTSGPAVNAAGQLPQGTESVRSHVHAHTEFAGGGSTQTSAAIESLLDRLFGSAVAFSGPWQEAIDLAIAWPSTTIVTKDGDRFGPSGWRIGTAGSGATGAALDEATARSEQAELERRQADQQLEQLRTALTAQRQREQATTRELEKAESSVRNLKNVIERTENDRHDVRSELESLTAHLVDLGERLEREQVRLSDITEQLPQAEAKEAELNERVQQMATARDELGKQTAQLASKRTDVEVRSAGIEERQRYLRDRIGQVKDRLAQNVAAAEDAEKRRVQLQARHGATQRLLEIITERVTVIEDNLGGLREERRKQSEAARDVTQRLEALRSQRQISEQTLEEMRTRQQRIEVAEAEVNLRIETTTVRIRTELDCEPATAMRAEQPLLPDGMSAPAKIRELERELRLMGPINPLALQEFAELSERHTFLEGQLEDIRQTRRELAKVIRAVDTEIVNVFTAAYADVSENFTRLFETLFPGGQGALSLTDPGDLLETGIEIEAKPSGKNVKKLSLLSGGERSLTALAYLFAVFRSRPSPFYVMDEVEAALDDVNLHRFLDLVAEFRQTAQLIIVSHQKRTMEAADVLYGVTMDPGGSSRVITEKASAVLDSSV